MEEWECLNPTITKFEDRTHRRVDDAADVASDDVLIRCDLRFRTFTAVLRSRVVALSDTEVRFLDADREAPQ